VSNDFIDKYDPLTKRYIKVPRPAVDMTTSPEGAGDIEGKKSVAELRGLSPQDDPDNPLYHAGGARSVRRLKDLRFDPIFELVEKYRMLEEELGRQERIRDGKLVLMTEVDGKPKQVKYSPYFHMEVFDRLLKVGETLLRYGYGRVPEMNELQVRRPSGMTIQLTKEGDVYQIGPDGANQDQSDD
jgi:hypothetical protein